MYKYIYTYIYTYIYRCIYICWICFIHMFMCTSIVYSLTVCYGRLPMKDNNSRFYKMVIFLSNVKLPEGITMVSSRPQVGI